MLTPLSPALQSDYTAVDLSYAATLWEEEPELLARAAAWHLALVGEGLDFLPRALVLDLGAALLRGPAGRLRSEVSYSSWGEGERAARLRYERELLARVAQHRLLRELFELEGAAPEGLVLHALRLICGRLAAHCPREVSQHPSRLRAVGPSALLAAPLAGEELAAREGALAAKLGEGLGEGLGAGAVGLGWLTRLLDALSADVRWRELVGEEDLFELTHLTLLSSDDLRLGCRQLMGLAAALGPLDPRAVLLPREDAAADSAFRDDTTYPTGGLTELTTSGAWENLVLSELAYIDDDPEGGVDIFDVRFVESELLFYLRDEGQLSCKRRALHFVVDLGELFLVKTRGYEHPFAGLASALCVALLRDLSALYLGDSLQFHIHFLTRGARPERVAAERELLRLLLCDEEQRGLVRFHDLSEELDERLLEDPRRERRVWVITEEVAGGLAGGRSRRLEWRERLERLRRDGVSAACAVIAPASALDLTAPPPPRRRQATYAEVTMPLGGLSLSDLRALKGWLAARLVGGRLRAQGAAVEVSP